MTFNSQEKYASSIVSCAGIAAHSYNMENTSCFIVVTMNKNVLWVLAYVGVDQ